MSREVDDLGAQLEKAIAGAPELRLEVRGEDAGLGKLVGQINGVLGRLEESLDSTRAREEAFEAVGQHLLSVLEEREAAEARLRRSEARFRAVLESSLDPVITVDHSGTVLSASRAVEEVLGWRPDDLVGRNVRELVPEPESGRRGESILQLIESALCESVAQPLEVEAIRRDGSRIPCGVQVTQVDLPDEDPFFAGVIRDLTQRRLLEMHLVQAQKLEATGRLAQGVAHEINTPAQYLADNLVFLRDSFAQLTAILGDCSRLLDQVKAGSASPELVEKIETACDEVDLDFLTDEIPCSIEQSLQGLERISAIVTSMKEFSLPEHEGRRAIDLNRAIQNTVAVSRGAWRGAVEIVLELDPELPQVVAAATQLNQALLNVITNAAQSIEDRLEAAGDETGTVTISTRCSQPGWVEIRISDTGLGIPEEIHDRVFDPFCTTREVGKGAGQGLSVAYATIVDVHGGTIEFETEPGQGTTFSIRLPTLDPEA